MKKISPETLQKLSRAPFAKAMAILMNSNEASLIKTAIYNLQVVSDGPGQDEFVREMLLPHLENEVVMDLPVYSEGGRNQTYKVINGLVCQFERDLGITFNSDEKASAIESAFLFLCAACHLRNTSLAAGLGITKKGLFRPRWESEF